MIAISYDEYEKYGCPSCGCDSAKPGGFVVCGEQDGTCRHCGLRFYLMPNGRKFTDTKISNGRKDENGEFIMESPKWIHHPRLGTPKWHYELPDIKPETGGEFWNPRGIGYDLSGFVKCKQAGERLLETVKTVLNKENPETWLDYREREPFWIQFKFSGTEFDLEKLYNLTKDTQIITEEIIRACVKEGT